VPIGHPHLQVGRAYWQASPTRRATVKTYGSELLRTRLSKGANGVGAAGQGSRQATELERDAGRFSRVKPVLARRVSTGSDRYWRQLLGPRRCRHGRLPAGTGHTHALQRGDQIAETVAGVKAAQGGHHPGADAAHRGVTPSDHDVADPITQEQSREQGRQCRSGHDAPQQPDGDLATRRPGPPTPAKDNDLPVKRSVRFEINPRVSASPELVTGSCRAVQPSRNQYDDWAVRDAVSVKPWIVDDELWAMVEPVLPPWPGRSPRSTADVGSVVPAGCAVRALHRDPLAAALVGAGLRLRPDLLGDAWSAGRTRASSSNCTGYFCHS
jgi:hypothetical protein